MSLPPVKNYLDRKFLSRSTSESAVNALFAKNIFCRNQRKYHRRNRGKFASKKNLPQRRKSTSNKAKSTLSTGCTDQSIPSSNTEDTICDCPKKAKCICLERLKRRESSSTFTNSPQCGSAKRKGNKVPCSEIKDSNEEDMEIIISKVDKCASQLGKSIICSTFVPESKKLRIFHTLTPVQVYDQAPGGMLIDSIQQIYSWDCKSPNASAYCYGSTHMRNGLHQNSILKSTSSRKMVARRISPRTKDKLIETLPVTKKFASNQTPPSIPVLKPAKRTPWHEMDMEVIVLIERLPDKLLQELLDKQTSNESEVNELKELKETPEINENGSIVVDAQAFHEFEQRYLLENPCKNDKEATSTIDKDADKTKKNMILSDFEHFYRSVIDSEFVNSESRNIFDNNVKKETSTISNKETSTISNRCMIVDAVRKEEEEETDGDDLEQFYCSEIESVDVMSEAEKGFDSFYDKEEDFDLFVDLKYTKVTKQKYLTDYFRKTHNQRKYWNVKRFA